MRFRTPSTDPKAIAEAIGVESLTAADEKHITKACAAVSGRSGDVVEDAYFTGGTEHDALYSPNGDTIDRLDGDPIQLLVAVRLWEAEADSIGLSMGQPRHRLLTPNMFHDLTLCLMRVILNRGSGDPQPLWEFYVDADHSPEKPWQDIERDWLCCGGLILTSLTLPALDALASRPESDKKRMSPEDANTIAWAELSKDRSFADLTCEKGAKRIGCATGTYHATEFWQQRTDLKGTGRKRGQDARPVAVPMSDGIQATMATGGVHQVAEDVARAEKLEKLKAEQAAEINADEKSERYGRCTKVYPRL